MECQMPRLPPKDVSGFAGKLFLHAGAGTSTELGRPSGIPKTP